MVRRNYAQVSSSEADQNNDNNEQSSYQHSSSSSTSTSATATATAITSEPDVEMSSRGRIGVRTSSSSSSRQRRQYSRLAVSAGNEEETQALAASSTASTTAAETSGLNTSIEEESAGGGGGLDDVNHASFSIDDEEDDGNDNGSGGFTVIILDVAQKKFSVTVPSSTSTIGDLKQAGYRVHKVPADRQRLIYRGKMLSNDNETLQEAGIVDDNKVILHLFPKPRVVIKDRSQKKGSFASSKQDSSVSNSTAGNENDDENNDNDNDSDDDDDTGARVPTIVLDPDEAERRSQILVLGSSDYVEAQNNVKLFSFMLLIISTIELMTLLSVALGVQQEENNYNSRSNGSSNSNSGGLYPYDQDDVFNNLDDGDFRHNRTSSSSSSSSTYNDMRVVDPSAVVYQQWTTASWFDLIISLLGVYVAILGIKASSESTLRLAQWYLAGTFVTGIGWMLWNFIMTYKIDVKINETRQSNHNNSNNTDDNFYYQNLDDDDIVWQAVSVMVLPGMVWFMCCLKAWQFQHLLSEAEQEAQERIRSEWSAMENAANGTTTTTTTSTADADNDNGIATSTTSNDPPPPQHDEELALQNQSATLS